MERLWRRPSAWLPVALSAAALALLAGYVALYGRGAPAEAHDEGTPARLFQLLMVAQLPPMAWFAIRWLPRRPVRAAGVLAIQLALAALAIGSVVWLES